MINKVFRNYQLPSTYKLIDMYVGCAGNPPNHPRYFVKSIYTGYGNSPRHGLPKYYLNGNGYTELEQVDKLFKPLPLEHERVQEWIKSLFSHMQHCYYKDPANRKYNDMVIYPVPYYELKSFVDDVRFSDEWRTQGKANTERANNEIEALHKSIATPDNHGATIVVRKYYPEFTPTQELIDNPPKSTGNWWTVLEHRPMPNKCPGESWKKHPVNGKWCQFCGWHKEDDE